MPSLPTPIDVEAAVSQRYSAGAHVVQPALCCPVDYDPRLLAAIPAEVLERDYGCDDPSRYLVEDAVISNCVLNLVAIEHKAQLFIEIFRVLRQGGRAVISDIVSAVEVPDHLRADPELWSGCISRAYQEEAFLAAFERAGFSGVQLVKRDAAPWQVVEEIELSSVTVLANKGEHLPATGCC